MIGVDAALAAILGRFHPLPAEKRPILESMGQVIAFDVVSPMNVPPRTNAAMDGYAVISEDTSLATAEHPVRLRVIEDLPAGRCARLTVEQGTAIRIMTGAPLPDGANTVVQFEHTGEGRGEARSDTVSIDRPTLSNVNIRLTGEDIRMGSVVLAAGTLIRPFEVGLLATLGMTTVDVHRKPRVAVLSTGDEIREPGQELSPGQIYDANTYTLAAMVTQAGGIPVRLGIATDNMDDLITRIDGAGPIDFLVTSAGVSVGDYDIVKKALSTIGEVTFYQVNMRPGRPLAFGVLRGFPVIGLPGNPVAAAISFELFGRAAIHRMLGRAPSTRPIIGARFEGNINNYDQRRSFYRVHLKQDGDSYIARLTGPQGSGILTSMSRADGLMVIDESTNTVQSGDQVKVWLLTSPESD